jgi:hypothetical protein
VTISSQEDFKSVVVKKLQSTNIYFGNNMPGLIIENPAEVIYLK